ncbi:MULTISPECIES: tetratricopeptide repeat protein [unclassified Tenacibaculum]|uniref:tetratricopeptide repeat protein n=1 Tax=unclassified Tenacibaculum TaxID=2635139 RepID=UPI001F3737DE|nr:MULTISPECIES: hypothetical protein [unclassified Tenacibaculum]MCF2874253.1 hypothetical protein [Tenacibaculum sp. Cn5-1]MCF2934834.1 hypothetical protein [Tenacibaculum sp. Cn5-34]MCG7511044.1 hypothetical protein [Tenacibaculum sp. Cn5-46]
MKNNKTFLFFLIIFLIAPLAILSQEKAITVKDYKEKVIKDYYRFQRTEDGQLLDSILRFIKLNKIDVEEDTIKSKIYYLNGVKNLFLTRYDKAEETFLKSYELAEKTNDILLKGTIFNSRGVTITKGSANYKKAKVLFEKAVVEYKKINEIPQQIDAYYNLTVNAKRRCKWEESNKYAFEFLKLLNKYEEKITGLRRMHYFIGHNYLRLKKYDDAFRNLKIAEGITFKDDSFSFTTSLINETYGKLHEEKKEYKKALERYKNVTNNLREANKETEKRIEDFYTRELELENELQEKGKEIIKDQNRIILWSVLTIVLLVVLILTQIFYWKKNKEKNREIKELNKELAGLIVDLKGKNKELSENKKEIENLLKLNEQALFSRVLKISTYNDAIRKICKDLETHLENNLDASSYFITINKKLLNLISEEELWEDFRIQFEKTRPDFYNKLKKVAPNLSVNDLKHCTYIVSNLKSKEVAQLVNVSPRSVETVRYRIKKKMGLEKEESLYDLLSNL